MLGHVESFRDDWENIIKPLYNITTSFKAALGMHETSVNHPKIAGRTATLRFRVYIFTLDIHVNIYFFYIFLVFTCKHYIHKNKLYIYTYAYINT